MTKVNRSFQNAMRHTLLISCIAMLGVAVPTIAQSPSAEFRRLDTNMDGRLTDEELKSISLQLKKQLDRNDDGEISTAEDIQHQVQSLSPSKQNVNYAENTNPRQTLDIWSVKNFKPKARLPIVVWIHGGAWRSGNKRQVHEAFKRLVLTRRYVGVSINYRLSQEARWPAQLHDCKAAIRWIQANAITFSGDAKRVIVMGSSAGGHLVSMLTTTTGDRSSEGTVGSKSGDKATVIGGINLYGPTDFLRMNDFPSVIDHDAPNSPESQLIGAPIQSRPELVNLANPIKFVDVTDPPLLLVHGTDDKLVCFNQSELLHRAIRAAGGRSTLLTISKGGHGGFITPKITSGIMSFADYLIGEKKQLPVDSTLPGKRTP